MSGLRLATASLALAGVAVAGYLTWVQYADLQPICVGGGDACERVQSSEYASLLGVPVALLGLVAYLALLASLVLPDAAGQVVAAFIALAGAAFSLYLTWVEVAELDALCQWCVASAALMVALAIVSAVRVVSAAPSPSRR
jgi:uncharacterized membrane protein